MIDAILACLDQTGPAHLSVWTWTIAEYEVQCMDRLRMDQRLLSGRLVIDFGARVKNSALIRQWKNTFGQESVRYARNHAKIATIQNDDWRLLLRGSMNLNYNPRFEQFDLTEGGADFELIREIENELPILPDNCTGEQAFRASRVTEAFDQGTLKLFGGMKTWAK